MMESVKDWLLAASLLLGILNLLWVWWRTSRSDIEATINRVETESEARAESARSAMKEHDRRIQTLEGDMKHLPTKDDFHDLKVVVTEAVGKLTAFEVEQKALGHTARRIEDILIAGERK